MYKAKNFDDALDKADQLIADGGYGHTSSIYLDVVTQQEKLEKFSERMKTCRILVNTPSLAGRYWRPLQFQACSFSDSGLRLLGAATRFPRTSA